MYHWLTLEYYTLACRFIGGLSTLHVFFTSQNTTTYEHFRARYNAQGNPYDLGLLSNWRQVFCTPMAPRLPEKLPGRVRPHPATPLLETHPPFRTTTQQIGNQNLVIRNPALAI